MTLAHATVEDELRALLAKATPGEWVLNDSCEVWHSVGPGGPLTQCIDAPDAALIVAAINALPALLDRLERAEKIEAAAREHKAAAADVYETFDGPTSVEMDDAETRFLLSEGVLAEALHVTLDVPR